MALTRFLVPLVPLALLAACGDESAADGDGRSASGQVLEGTISDDMLPLDKVQSEPPLLAPEAAVMGGDEAEEAGAEPEPAGDQVAAPEAEGESDAEPAPDEQPVPE